LIKENNLVKKIAIIIQGPSDYIEQQKKAWEEYEHIIYATWEGSQNLYSHEDKVVFIEMPINKGGGNINLQKNTTLEGLKYAKHLGYEKALKLRSDIIPTRWPNFLSILNTNKLNFLCWHKNPILNHNQYLVDYLMAGNIDDLILLWENCFDTNTIAEGCLMDSFNKNFKIEHLYFLVDKLTIENDLHWLKYNKFLSSYNLYNCYTVN
jgi:hypothetical protein